MNSESKWYSKSWTQVTIELKETAECKEFREQLNSEDQLDLDSRPQESVI